MAAPAQAAVSGLCPNCHERIPDTKVSFEETMFSEMRATRVGRVAQQRSQRNIVRYGTVTLCAECAAAYQRCVRLRTVGRRLMNAGAISMIVFALIYALVLSGAAQQGLAGLIVGVLVGLCALVLVVGVVMYAGGRMMRRTAARFVGKLQTR